MGSPPSKRSLSLREWLLTAEDTKRRHSRGGLLQYNWKLDRNLLQQELLHCVRGMHHMGGVCVARRHCATLHQPSWFLARGNGSHLRSSWAPRPLQRRGQRALSTRAVVWVSRALGYLSRTGEEATSAPMFCPSSPLSEKKKEYRSRVYFGTRTNIPGDCDSTGTTRCTNKSTTQNSGKDACWQKS